MLWLAVLIVFGGISSMVGTAYSTEFALPDVESRRGFDILDEHFADSGAGGEGGTIVFRAEQGVTDPEVQRAMTAYFDRAGQIEGITLISPYTPEGAQQIASQGPEAGLIAYAQIGLPRDITLEEATAIGAELKELMPEIAGVQIEIGGADPRRVRGTELRAAGPGLRHDRAHPRVRVGARHGSPRRHRPCRHRGGDDPRRIPDPRPVDPRLRHDDRRDARPRCRHRLRALHRDPIPGEHA